MRSRFAPHLFAVAVAAAGSGCGLVSYPFSFDADGSVRVPLGVVTDCTSNDDGTIPADGQPDEDGNLTRFTHRLEGSVCHMHAEWTGPLVDVAEIRADAEEEMRDNGLDPENVAVEIAAIEPEVTAVGLSGREGATLTRGVTYTGTVFVDDASESGAPLLDLVSTADASAPEVTVHESPDLLAVANEAWDAGEAIFGRGVADVAVDLAQLEGDLTQLPERPALRVRFVITLEGEAALE